MILRCTAKMLTLLGIRATALPDVPPSDDDWYLEASNSAARFSGRDRA